MQIADTIILPTCSAKACLPTKLAKLLTGTQTIEGSSALSNSSMSAALADMFPADLGPLIDVSGKRYAHTVCCNMLPVPPGSIFVQSATLACSRACAVPDK